MKRTFLLALALMATTSLVVAEAAAPAKKIAPPRRQNVDLVLCLDTSGSMSGLIDSAKQKLWAVVNELATANPRPVLRVALYQYGNSGLNEETGWVQKICDLTGDLDTVYGKLFALKTNGGTEYVARVVHRATEDLKWDTSRQTLRIIFVAGNEAATQDKTRKLQDVCKAAATKGIIINTIFCGAVDSGRQTGWADAARWADGRYAAIDQNRGTVVINTPYDKKLGELSQKLNTTYLAYGVRGKAGRANQVKQDSNSATLGVAVTAQRAAAKAGALYTNAEWDLVDAVNNKKLNLDEVAVKDLPKKMQGMTPEQRKKHVAEQAELRKKIQKEIKEFSDKRDAFRKREMAAKGLNETSAFDAALRGAVREQAERKNFTFQQK